MLKGKGKVSDLLRGKKWLLFILILFMAAANIGLTLASREPDTTAIITKSGVKMEGDFLGNVKYGWYPGQVKEGILRVRNDGPGSLKIYAIDVEVILKNAYGSLIDPGKYDYQIYSISIKDGDTVLFPRENNASHPAINLKKNGFVDLNYRVEMDKRCGNELQGSQARITIAVNLTKP